jgi:ATP-dependent DNA helicase RecQ
MARVVRDNRGVLSSSALSLPPSLPSLPQPARSPVSAAHTVLSSVFGYQHFKGQQREVIEHVADGGDALVLMPTGGGKSLCYQVPAIVRHQQGHGVTVVVSPLIALMHDQVGALEEAGVHAGFLNSTQDSDAVQAIEREVREHRLVMLYIAPERLVAPRMVALLDALHAQGKLSLFAIDEAHCVSQWGHDFREDYLALSMLHERYAGVPRVALTATADALTREDIVERLALTQAQRFVASFDRPNIVYTVVEKDEPRKQLLSFLRSYHKGDAGIVYCGTRKKVDDLAAWLDQQGVPALPYHAGLDSSVRQQHQDRFLREEGLVMVATIAFGMGIDKPDVRFVAHLDLPKSMEGYYQETGRAGRDGQPASAWMAYGLADVVNQRRMIDDGTANEAFKRQQRGKLEALLAMAEAADCRRVRLLAYFGEGYASPECGHCDNCRTPPRTWDATQAARMALSCIVRMHQACGLTFGVQHLMDVLQGRPTEKVQQHGLQRISTFGIGAALDDARWRLVIRQLLALGHIEPQGDYNTLSVTASARAVLRGETALWLREPTAAPARVAGGRGARSEGSASGSKPKVSIADTLDMASLARFEALKAWRSQVAREHQLPAYVIFHDTTLASMAREAPESLAGLAGIAGMGVKKLQAYGPQLLTVLQAQR